MLELSNKKFSYEELNNGINIQTPKLNYEEYTQTKFNYVSSLFNNIFYIILLFLQIYTC